jgi:hypothetical protein
MTMTKPTSEQVTFLAAGSGATQRTALEKFRDVISVQDFGAIGNTTNGTDGNDDTAAVQAALNAAVGAGPRGYVRFVPGKQYRITSTLNVPASIIVDFSGALILAPTVTTLFRISGNASLIGYLGYLQTSGNAGSAIELATKSSASTSFLRGNFTVAATNTRVAGSIAVDITGCIGSVIECNVIGFETAFGNDISVTTATCYYNQFLNNRAIGCNYGIRLRATATHIVNGTDIHSFDFNGQGHGIYAIQSESAGTITVIGGYIEGLEAANANMRGIIAESSLGAGATTVSIIGTAIDSSSSASNYAIEFGANTPGCVVHGVRFGGGLASSSKTILAAASAPYSFIGAGTATHARIGRTGAGTAASAGDMLCGQVDCTKVIQSGSFAADNAATFANTADGDGISITTASSTATRSSINCVRSAEGRVIATSVSGSPFAGIFVGNGSPETVYSAQPGSLYLRKDGSAGTCLYVKESGTGNTGWVAK